MKSSTQVSHKEMIIDYPKFHPVFFVTGQVMAIKNHL